MSSVLTGITGAVRANIAGAAQQAIKSASNNIKTISGLPIEGGNSALPQISNLMGGMSSNILTYPFDVDTDPQQGHYILFHINTRKNGKLLTPKSGKNMNEAIEKIQNELGAAGHDDGGEDEVLQYFPSLESQAIDGKKVPKVAGGRGNINRSIVLSKLPTKRLEKSIALYMPPSVQVSYNVKYADQKIGAIAMAGSAVIDAFVSEGPTLAKLKGITDALVNNSREGLTGMAIEAVDAVASGTSTIVELKRGSVITPRMEMMFEGVGRREFTYTFVFIPKSKQEALVVEDIIKHFKFYMMPAYSNPNTRREMDIPGTFDIEYMYKGNRNNFLNKVSTCFLKSVQVQYGADRYTAYEEIPGKGSPPQRSQITLNFTELEILSQDHIAEGY